MIKQINFNKNNINLCNMELRNKTVTQSFSKGSKIKIKKKNRGKFNIDIKHD